MTDYIVIGKILKPKGIKGELKVLPLTEKIDRFDEMDSLYIQFGDELKKHKIDNAYYNNSFVFIKLAGVNSIEEAEVYRGCYLKIHKENAIKLEDGSYFIFDIIGLRVYTEEGLLLGIVKEVLKTGSNDVYIVEDETKKQVLIPALKQVVKEIDIEKRIMCVKLLEGMDME